MQIIFHTLRFLRPCPARLLFLQFYQGISKEAHLLSLAGFSGQVSKTELKFIYSIDISELSSPDSNLKELFFYDEAKSKITHMHIHIHTFKCK